MDKTHHQISDSIPSIAFFLTPDAASIVDKLVSHRDNSRHLQSKDRRTDKYPSNQWICKARKRPSNFFASSCHIRSNDWIALGNPHASSIVISEWSLSACGLRLMSGLFSMFHERLLHLLNLPTYSLQEQVGSFDPIKWLLLSRLTLIDGCSWLVMANFRQFAEILFHNLSNSVSLFGIWLVSKT